MQTKPIDFTKYYNLIQGYPRLKIRGRVTQVIGLVMEISGLSPFVGEVCLVDEARRVPAEVVGFRQGRALLMPLGSLSGIGPGSLVEPTGKPFTIRVGPQLLGKVLDGLGRPLQGGEFRGNFEEYPIEKSPPNPLERKPIDKVLATGIKSIDTLITCGQGQRIGIFSGSGVGKSTLMGMIARYSEADVNIIGLVGERGREVGDFLDNDLGPEGLRRSVVIASTSDRPALERVKAALVATAVAEYFREQGLKVILMMDSVTRFATALREIGLAIGEPPATRGYTPSVFAALPRLLERSGNSDKGSITGFYTVLVDGDDMNEPVSDTVRSILDGHIILNRELAARNHYPAIDVLGSISRLMPYLVSEKQKKLAMQVRELLATFKEAEDLINIGAYVHGSNPKIDRAIAYSEKLNRFLCQDINEHFSWQQSLELLQQLFVS
jgi:flagellum-specific ATP synthase